MICWHRLNTIGHELLMNICVVLSVTSFVQIEIPSANAIHWCAAFRLPEDIRSQTKYITKVGC